MVKSSYTITETNFMKLAIAMGRQGLGKVCPNPSVGCVIVKEGHIIAKSRTADGGRPHAETEALKIAGVMAEGSEVYVSLEPCSHHGKTPPCAEALIKAKVAKVYIACLDSDERVSGRGVKMLQDAGISVDVGLCADEARKGNQGFFKRVEANLPLVTVKIASSMDGKIALSNGESKWITGEYARRYGHKLRAEHDAIMIGAASVVSDNPMLDCRIEGLNKYSPIRIITDGKNNKINDIYNIVKSSHDIKTYLLYNGNQDERTDKLAQNGVELIKADSLDDGSLDMRNVLHKIAEIGVTRLLVEGGARLVSAFIEQNLADYVYWFRAPFCIGNDGLSAIKNIGLTALANKQNYNYVESIKLGVDLLDIYEVRR